VWLDTIHRESRKGVSARAAIGKTAWGEGRSARTLRSVYLAIAATTESSSLVRVCSFETTGLAAVAASIAADTAERPSSGAKLARISRPNRTEVLLLPMLA